MRRWDEDSKIDGLKIVPWQAYEARIADAVVRAPRSAVRPVPAWQRTCARCVPNLQYGYYSTIIVRT